MSTEYKLQIRQPVHPQAAALRCVYILASATDLYSVSVALLVRFNIDFHSPVGT